jgi:hypothetical protein
MPTKPRTTKKPAAKPQRKPRKPTEKTASSMIQGPSIGSVILQKLDELLAKPDNPSFDAVAGWTVEKLGDGVTGYRANYATDTGPSPIATPTDAPPVSDALDRIAYALKSAEDITQVGHRMLEKYLTPLPPSKDGCGISTCTRGQSDFVRALNEVADRIFADNDARRNILDRLEL